MTNPFSLAVDAALAKTFVAKKYLMEIRGLTEAEADAILAQIALEHP